MSNHFVGSGADFHLSDEILSVIPTDAYDQLDLARKITSMAIASRVSKLESESGRLRLKIIEKDNFISELQEKLSMAEQKFHDAEARLQPTLQENIKLSSELDVMAATVKKLNRDLTKLDKFKRQLMQSLNDDNLTQVATVDIKTCDQSVAKSYEGSNGYLATDFVSASTEKGDTAQYSIPSISMTPHITPRLTPSATPKVISTNYSAALSPKNISGTTSPTRSHFGGRTALSSWCTPSAQSSAASSPPNGQSVRARTRIDGKEFFRQARNRLSFEQFSAFLINIKELNAHRQSREDTSRKTEEIFGFDNKDLFLSFQRLLNCSMP